MEDVVKTATGVFIGGLLALLAHDWVLARAAEYQAEQAIKAMNAQIEKTTRRQAVEDAERQQTRRAAETAAREEITRAQEAAEAARLNALGKEATFQRRYQPSPKCKADPSTMECANEHMRARKEFDANWGK